MINQWLEESKKSPYQKRLEEGKTEVHTTSDFKCSICGDQLCSDTSMGGYYERRSHFQHKHGMTTEEARYASLNIGSDSDIVESALSSFSKSMGIDENQETQAK